MIRKQSDRIHKDDPRPQRMSAWFAVITVADFADLKTDRIPFLDAFVTMRQEGSEYVVLFEGEHPMVSIVRFGLVIVWHGPNLQNPERPPPELFTQAQGDEYYTSSKRHYPDTHLMDFLENSGDVLHFYTTHKWHKADIESYDYDEHTMKYMLVGELSYAQSADRFDKKVAGWVLPKVPTRTEVNFLGPGFVESRAVTLRGLKLNALVTITPTGENGTSIYAILNINTSWVPRRLRKVFNKLSPKTVHELMAFVFTNAVIDDLSGDYRIWSKRKFLRDPALILPKEQHVLNIRTWIETFYPADFRYPAEAARPEDDKSWQPLDTADNIQGDQVSSYNIAGEELVAYRDGDGHVVVLNAHCPHHGAHLGYETHIESGCIRCPFHHFYFDAQGKCKAKDPHKKGNYIKHLSTEPRRHRLVGETVQVWV
jgi:nitrite reductase/ring-hydroxylating ferredoxin subunit